MITVGGADLGSEYTLHTDSNQAHEEFVTQRLREFNRRRSPGALTWDDPQCVPSPLQVYILDREGVVVAGLIGRMHHIPKWLEITVLWVDEPLRGQGLGRKLMERAEEQARARGCRYARLTTADYQAPGFYERLGYHCYGTLEDCPPGETVHLYRKDL
jgi:ribosomal protein S18 acetylase RimI-like enzyme